MLERLREAVKDFHYRRKGVWVGNHPRNVHGRGPTQIVTPEEYRENRLVREFYGHKRMPCCGSKQYQEGPRGGMSMNIRCACGKRYDVCQPAGTIEEI